MVSRYFQAVKFQYVPREDNTMTGWLARACPSSEVEHDIVDFPMFLVRKLLLEDKMENFSCENKLKEIKPPNRSFLQLTYR